MIRDLVESNRICWGSAIFFLGLCFICQYKLTQSILRCMSKLHAVIMNYMKHSAKITSHFIANYVML